MQLWARRLIPLFRFCTLDDGHERAVTMRHKKTKNYGRKMLRLPDLDHSKLAVLNSLTASSSRRVYQYAIEQFIAWYCSEPRLAFNRIVVVRYRTHLVLRPAARIPLARYQMLAASPARQDLTNESAILSGIACTSKDEDRRNDT